MWNSYFSFLDYLELRRRIERRLARGHLLFLHTFAFVSFAILMAASAQHSLGSFYRSYFVDLGTGQFTAIWSIALALHGMLVYARSGAFAARRGWVVEDEMRHRIEADATFLSDEPSDLFRLHALLEDDIARRSSFVTPLSAFTMINVVMWVTWSFVAIHSAFSWHMVLVFGPILLLLLLRSFVQQQRHNYQLRQRMLSAERPREAKELRQYAQEAAAYNPAARLSADQDELLTLEEYREKTKRGS